MFRNPFRNRNLYKEGTRQAYPRVYLNEGGSVASPSKRSDREFPTNEIYTTKYSVWSYLPKVLYEQFRKFTSLYFLLVAVITLVPSVSPFSPWTSVLGLLFILAVAMVREAYEDYLRMEADRRVNNRRFIVIEPESGDRYTTRCRNLRVGDIVFVREDEPVPADIVLLSSGNRDGSCYIDTSQLDGETNLKLRWPPEHTKHMSLRQVASLRGYLECMPPASSLHDFTGTLVLQEDRRRNEHDIVVVDDDDDGEMKIGIDIGTLLLRGSSLRNTTWVCGVVAYAGPETKLILNGRDPPSKFSSLDYRINKYVVGICVFQVVLCIAMGLVAGIFQSQGSSSAWYLGSVSNESSAALGAQTALVYFALTSYLIPISLVVTLELVKVVQGKFMEWDADMTVLNEESGEWQGMTVKTSNLNDDLGMVEYIFSDKTGTLTENRMTFRRCAIGEQSIAYHSAGDGQLGDHYFSSNRSGGNIGGDANDDDDDDDDDRKERSARSLEREFLLNMSLCHSCVVTDDQSYRSPSPDEEALCAGARENRFVFERRDGGYAWLSVGGEALRVEVLYVLDFTSDRRRMSVLVRMPDECVALYSKGADGEMLGRLRAGTRTDALEAQLEEFATEGLRVLVLARRSLSDAEFERFCSDYRRASTMLEGRDLELERVNDALERDLELLGCTAIEDELQADVPETIAYLLRAGIKLWVITGDKQATAINIGYSSRLLTADMTLIKVNAEHSSERCGAILADAVERYCGGAIASQQRIAMVIDGATLRYALDEHADLFMALAERCASVVCCKAGASRKGAVVELIKRRTSAICLAIGDGANDVTMLREAHIGIGIFGREGSQAARSSDYALHQFRHLRRLLCVHGRYALIRNAAVTLYSFYKNAAIFLVQVWFSFFSVASAQTLYDDWIMMFFNITITSWPPLLLGCFEKDIDERIIERHPETYGRTRRNENIFRLRTLIEWMASATYHSLVLFFGTAAFLAQPASVLVSGQSGGLALFGDMVMTVGVVVIFCKLALETLHWTWPTHVGLWGSLALYFATVAVEDTWFTIFPDQYGVFSKIVTAAPAFWLWLVVAVGICLLPDLVVLYARRQYWPEPWYILRERYRLLWHNRAANGDDDNDEPIDLVASETTSLLGSNGGAASSSSYQSPPRDVHQKPNRFSNRMDREVPQSPMSPVKY
jgi:phospholipid-transporting ATPase